MWTLKFAWTQVSQRSPTTLSRIFVNNNNNNNKCIGDDTKAAVRQSLSCIKTKDKIWRKRFSIWRMELLHPAMWHVALESWQWIHQVAAPCNVIRGSGMTSLNSPKRPPYWNSTSGFDFDHITAVDMHQSSKFYPNRTTLGRKMTSCRFSRWRISAILNFRDPIRASLKSPIT